MGDIVSQQIHGSSQLECMSCELPVALPSMIIDEISNEKLISLTKRTSNWQISTTNCDNCNTCTRDSKWRRKKSQTAM